jgi:hypothetical protein
LNNHKNIVLPIFLIVGAAKSGTTSLYNYLKAHPEIFMSEIKEPCFFSSYKVPYDIFEKNIYPAGKDTLVRDLENYTKLFRDANYKKINAIGEASTHYLFQYKETINNIKEVYKNYKINFSDIKIIIILRNPIEAAYSNYTMWNMKGKEVESFEKAIENSPKRLEDKYFNTAYINKFKYYDEVSAYKNNFNNVKVFLFEDLKKNPEKLLKETLDFLKINEIDFIPNNLGSKYNPSGKPKNKLIASFISTDNTIKNILKPIVNFILPEDIKMDLINKVKSMNLEKEQMSSKMKKHLTEIYKEDIIKTQNLIERDLSDWLK